MHAERDSDHLCGAERLVTSDAVEAVSTELLKRAMVLSPGAVNLKVEAVEPEQIVYGAIPEITLMPQVGYEEGRAEAVKTLIVAGVSEQSALSAMAAIAAGASSAGIAMRGAMLVDAETGDRLEADPDRGVRATRLDLTDETAVSLTALLQAHGLFHLRTKEALVLAAKVMAAPSVVAELCWSDAADYTAGYVASKQTGYCRFTALKPLADLRGGRAFFVRPGADIAVTTAFLEQTPFLVNRHGGVHSLMVNK
jgi:6-carboxyhexanoate--CoA ligase